MTTAENKYQRLRAYARRMVIDWDEQLSDRVFGAALEAHGKTLRRSSREYLTHPLDVAWAVCEFSCDMVTFVAAMLHDVVEDTDVTLEEIEQEFGQRVAFIVDSLSKDGNGTDATLQKLLNGIAKDIRVAYIKFADRVHNLKTINVMPSEHRTLKAAQALEVFAPLARVLGIESFAIQIEDLAVGCLVDRGEYSRLEIILHEHNSRMESYLRNLWKSLHTMLSESVVIPDGTSLDCSFELPRLAELYHDSMTSVELASKLELETPVIRIMVRQPSEAKSKTDHMLCLDILTVIRNNWQAVDVELHDFISFPSYLGYQAIHTTVLEPQGKKIEVRVCTPQMHLASTLGPITQLRRPSQGNYDRALTLVNAQYYISEINQRMYGHPGELVSVLKSDVFARKIHVFLNTGELRWLPENSTVLDLACLKDELIGYHCLGAYLDGTMSHIAARLYPKMHVVLLSDTSVYPKPMWKEFVHTGLARFLVNNWLVSQGHVTVNNY